MATAEASERFEWSMNFSPMSCKKKSKFVISFDAVSGICNGGENEHHRAREEETEKKVNESSRIMVTRRPTAEKKRFIHDEKQMISVNSEECKTTHFGLLSPFSASSTPPTIVSLLKSMSLMVRFSFAVKLFSKTLLSLRNCCDEAGLRSPPEKMLRSAVDVTDVSASDRLELPSIEPPSSDSVFCTVNEKISVKWIFHLFLTFCFLRKRRHIDFHRVSPLTLN